MTNFSAYQMKNLRKIIRSIITFRKFFIVFADVISIIISIQLGHYLVTNSSANIFSEKLLFLLSSILVIIISFIFSGQYKSITRYLSSLEIYKIFIRILVSQLFIYFISSLIKIYVPSFKIFLITTILLIIFISSSRFLIRDIFLNIDSLFNWKKKKRVAIYGAGAAGVQLLSSLKVSNNYSVICFFDDSKDLWDKYLNGIQIKNPNQIENKTLKIEKIFLAIPSLKRSKLNKILNKVYSSKISILQIPSLEEITSGAVKIDKLRPLLIEDLLGRNEVKIKPEIILKSIKDKNILITGAGGSIGSELCLQILKCNPKKLVMVDNSEPNLYFIDKKLKEQNLNERIRVISILGDVTNQTLVENLLKEQNISTIFHSAAYKHVPIVESNPIQGLKNNIFSTFNICEKAIKHRIEKVILISSDKAVRPTNIMGASKRISELIIQAFDEEIKSNKKSKNVSTKLSMVRFGNVLNSSGSVVPLFKEQISKGGPITLTHPDIIRYFMTIEEASQLVLQAAALSTGGDLFLLDMGDPIKILDLAKQMIYLTGLKIKDLDNPYGDIEIKTTGLRSGEKLYEELLIDNNCVSTSHPQIFKAKEKFIPASDLWPKLEELKESLDSFNELKSLDIIKELIPEWVRIVK
ncbi:MAG: polysaccharide biosynthesis protein [Prochlorococcus marinus XMU1423]|nr:polysaccharide biosynthesis protein [Prochlorococcus marinus XMU1423]